MTSEQEAELGCRTHRPVMFYTECRYHDDPDTFAQHIDTNPAIPDDQAEEQVGEYEDWWFDQHFYCDEGFYTCDEPENQYGVHCPECTEVLNYDVPWPCVWYRLTQDEVARILLCGE